MIERVKNPTSSKWFSPHELVRVSGIYRILMEFRVGVKMICAFLNCDCSVGFIVIQLEELIICQLD